MKYTNTLSFLQAWVRFVVFVTLTCILVIPDGKLMIWSWSVILTLLVFWIMNKILPERENEPLDMLRFIILFITWGIIIPFSSVIGISHWITLTLISAFSHEFAYRLWKFMNW